MYLKIDDNRKVWITSDTHYSQKNICRATTDWRTINGEIPIEETRNFNSILEMNNTIVNNINSVVDENDILIHCGDWSFGGIDMISTFRNQLFVKEIHIVTGNHDHHIRKNNNNVQSLFTTINDRIELKYKKKLIIIDHFPLLTWEDRRKGSIMLHGHSHSPQEKRFGNGRTMDIGIDGHPEFRPYDLYEECVVHLLKLEIFSSNDKL